MFDSLVAVLAGADPESRPTAFESDFNLVSMSSSDDYGVFESSEGKVVGCRVPCVRVSIHCSQPHLECVSHVTLSTCEYKVSDAIRNGFMEDAYLVTPEPEMLGQSGDTYPNGDRHDYVISRKALAHAFDFADSNPGASIILRIPNHFLPRHPGTNEISDWPYLTVECAQAIYERFQHLRTNSPSIERKHSHGGMWAHCIFFGIDPEFRQAGDTCPSRTIGELFNLPNELADGRYGLRCPFAEMGLDCAITVPLLFK